MKKIKLLIIISILFLLTGCSGSYDVTLNQNLTVDEKVKIDLKDTGGIYEKARELFINNDIDEKKYKVVQKDNKVSVTYNESYESIEDYILNSVLYKQLFDDINYTKQKNQIEIKTAGKLKLDSKNQIDIINDYNVDLLQINFNTNLKVYDTNADESYDGKYTWKLTSDSNDKEIIIKINPTNREFNYKYIIVISLIVLISVFFLIRFLRKIIKSSNV